MRGVKSSVVDKYTDQAHFIYKLLQNADDAEAKYARFKLYHDKLAFAHNGERHFSVSSPSSEELDRENGTLGDVNAILSIGNSSKNVSELRTSTWLCTRSGGFVNPSQTYVAALVEGYDVSPPAAQRFIRFLKMPFENPELSRLSPKQREDSALFAYEFTAWISAIISQNNTTEKFSIGVIATYKAQADLIDRLISSVKIPGNISVQTGTIHGFQGDECEIIISVYNPPPSISD